MTILRDSDRQSGRERTRNKKTLAPCDFQLRISHYSWPQQAVINLTVNILRKSCHVTHTPAGQALNRKSKIEMGRVPMQMRRIMMLSVSAKCRASFHLFRLKHFTCIIYGGAKRRGRWQAVDIVYCFAYSYSSC